MHQKKLIKRFNSNLEIYFKKRNTKQSFDRCLYLVILQKDTIQGRELNNHKMTKKTQNIYFY